jgi:putative inorganic carbon (hco3(-)) transporter
MFLLVVLFAFFAMDKLLLFTFALVPISVQLTEFFPAFDYDLSLPTEPILVGILLLFIFKQIRDRDIDKKIVRHPVSYFIYFYLAWILITSFTSTMPLVSFKFFVSKLWFIIPFFFLMVVLFKKLNNIYLSFWLYIIPFIGVIAYTFINHAPHYFSQQAANYVMAPFYKDHTSYGALLAMYIPILLGFVANKSLSFRLRIVSFVVFTLFIVATVFSYTRAAWISLIAAAVFWVVLKLKIPFKYILIVAVAFGSLFLVYQSKIMMVLESNNQDSSTNFKEHVQSISNVATDASNLERINRWNCAFRMFKEKPILGWGPGTYQFNYAPFQFSYEKTIISTNAGDMGNAHSEYFGPLSESGVLGMLSMLLIVVIVYYIGIKNYYTLKNGKIKLLLLATLCALTTYFVHGFLNNFLDTDKASAPFWSFIAIVVAIDIYHNKQKEELPK